MMFPAGCLADNPAAGPAQLPKCTANAIPARRALRRSRTLCRWESDFDVEGEGRTALPSDCRPHDKSSGSGGFRRARKFPHPDHLR